MPSDSLEHGEYKQQVAQLGSVHRQLGSILAEAIGFLYALDVMTRTPGWRPTIGSLRQNGLFKGLVVRLEVLLDLVSGDSAASTTATDLTRCMELVRAIKCRPSEKETGMSFVVLQACLACFLAKLDPEQWMRTQLLPPVQEFLDAIGTPLARVTPEHLPRLLDLVRSEVERLGG